MVQHLFPTCCPYGSSALPTGPQTEGTCKQGHSHLSISIKELKNEGEQGGLLWFYSTGWDYEAMNSGFDQNKLCKLLTWHLLRLHSLLVGQGPLVGVGCVLRDASAWVQTCFVFRLRVCSWWEIKARTVKLEWRWAANVKVCNTRRTIVVVDSRGERRALWRCFVDVKMVEEYKRIVGVCNSITISWAGLAINFFFSCYARIWAQTLH